MLKNLLFGMQGRISSSDELSTGEVEKIRLRQSI